MKITILLGVCLLFTETSLAEVPSSSNLTQIILNSKARYGLENFKIVMPGTLYRGGSSGDKAPLSVKSAQALCKDGFSTAIYVYNRNWDNKSHLTKCQSGQLEYLMLRWDHPSEVHQVLKKLKYIIDKRTGPMYVHCWYGVHASGYVAAVALKQFCGFSNSQAISYWNSNVPKKIQYAKVQTMIQNFKPYPDLLITAEQQARVCLKNNNDSLKY